MDKELFLLILSSQKKWAEEYKEQEQQKRIEKNKKCLLLNWYSNSAEYKRNYKQSGSQGFNK